MKAVIYDRDGGPEVLRLEDTPKPSPAAGQVLVKVAATSINLSDWECLRGSPAYARIGARALSGAPYPRVGHRRCGRGGRRRGDRF